jgi:hypothetical protein
VARDGGEVAVAILEANVRIDKAGGFGVIIAGAVTGAWAQPRTGARLAAANSYFRGVYR